MTNERDYVEKNTNAGHSSNSVEDIRFRMFKDRIERAILHILHSLHDIQPLRPGEQITVPVGMDCGWSGEFVLRIDELGECKPVVSDEEIEFAAQRSVDQMKQHEESHKPGQGHGTEGRLTKEEIQGMRIQVQGPSVN
jgi:hypothetical protein